MNDSQKKIINLTEKIIDKEKINKSINENYRLDIKDSDILFMNNDVCILKPEIKKGILVFTHYSNVDAYKNGLKSGKQLHEEGIEFGRLIYHPYIFFRAPYKTDKMDYSSLEKEISCSYGKINKKNLAFIRVDPIRTYVYSSEIRARKYSEQEHYILKSRKTLLDYLKIITHNKEKIVGISDNLITVYNLFSSEVIYARSRDDEFIPRFPMDLIPIERNSEILVKTSHIPKDYFVFCKKCKNICDGCNININIIFN